MAKRERRVRSTEGALDHIKYAIAKGNTLSESAMYAIHAASLEILRDVGMKVESEEARNLFAEGGCFVEGDIVKFPSTVVEEAIQSASS